MIDERTRDGSGGEAGGRKRNCFSLDSSTVGSQPRDSPWRSCEDRSIYRNRSDIDQIDFRARLWKREFLNWSQRTWMVCYARWILKIYLIQTLRKTSRPLFEVGLKKTQYLLAARRHQIWIWLKSLEHMRRHEARPRPLARSYCWIDFVANGHLGDSAKIWEMVDNQDERDTSEGWQTSRRRKR